MGPSRLEMIHAPQGRVPVPTSLVALGPMGMGSRPESRPDFARGFGLDIPEEDEPEEEEAVVRCDDHEEEDDDDDDDDDEHGEDVVEGVSRDVEEGDTVDVDASREDVDEGCAIADIEFNLDSDEGEEEDEDGLSTVGQSRIHSRHVSKLSAALSLVSVGRVVDDSDVLGMSEGQEMVPSRSPIGEVDVDLDVDEDGEAIGEWTGSEDLGSNGGGSDDEVSGSVTFFHIR